MIIEVVLPSDNQPISVRRLGLFELDKVKPPDTRRYTVKITLGGREYEQEYDLSAFDDSDRPRKPDTPLEEAIENTQPWYDWQEYLRYQAGLLFHHNQLADAWRYLREIRAYILENCIQPEDRARILTAEDWEVVAKAAQVPQLTMVELERTIAYTFQATFEGVSVLKAILSLEDDPDRPDTRLSPLRAWELQAIGQFTEAEWAELPLDERARRVVRTKLDDWLAALEHDWMKRNRRPDPGAAVVKEG